MTTPVEPKPDVDALMQTWVNQNRERARMNEQERDLIQAFALRFPLESLQNLPLEEYTLGRGDNDNFCYWLEWKTGNLGSISGGTAKKFGVYWSAKEKAYKVNQMFRDAEDARQRILGAVRAGEHALSEDDVPGADAATAVMGENRYGVRHKPIYLYHPDKLLPISNPYHIQGFLRQLGETPSGGPMAMNRQLLQALADHAEAAGLDNLGIGRFLYDTFPPDDPGAGGPDVVVDPRPDLPLVSYLLEVAEMTRNIVLYGPPGTGKTFVARAFADAWVAKQPKAGVDAPYVQLVTFHPSYSYEEFVEGLRPSADGQGLTVRDGVFKRICAAARADSENDYVLIIDEINRADSARTFGELITLLEDDKRAQPGQSVRYEATLPYSESPGNHFSVPENLYVIGTMNTADRSISLMDLALRRRFTFVEVPPEPALVSGTVTGLSLERLLRTLNTKIAETLDRDHAVGHAYLMADTMTPRHLAFRWRHKVIPLLQEYVYGRDGELVGLLGKRLAADATGAAPLDDSALVAALKTFAQD